MSWFCQSLTEDNKLCWLPKGHTDECKPAPIQNYPVFVQHPLTERIAVVSFDPPVSVDGAVQLTLPGL